MQLKNKIITLIPAYKTEFIEQLFHSIKSQQYIPNLVIVSDDSPDNRVTKKINSSQIQKYCDEIEVRIFEGPKKGTYQNMLFLLSKAPTSADYFHFLFDDDQIYPSFYSTHISCHSSNNVLCTVSKRWISNSSGLPTYAPKLPEEIEFKNLHKFISFGLPDIFNFSISRRLNFFGELSNLLFKPELIEKFSTMKLGRWPFIGLGDIGLICNAAERNPVIFINEFLGAFRHSETQHSVNASSLAWICAATGWASLAHAGYEIGLLSKEQTSKVCLNALNFYKKYTTAKINKDLIHFISKSTSCQLNDREDFHKFWSEFCHPLMVNQ